MRDLGVQGFIRDLRAQGFWVQGATFSGSALGSVPFATGLYSKAPER